MHAADSKENVQNRDNDVIQFKITNNTFLDIQLIEIRGNQYLSQHLRKNKWKTKAIWKKCSQLGTKFNWTESLMNTTLKIKR